MTALSMSGVLVQGGGKYMDIYLVMFLNNRTYSQTSNNLLIYAQVVWSGGRYRGPSINVKCYYFWLP